MWTRKSDQQIAEERSRPDRYWLSFSGPICVFVIWSILGLFSLVFSKSGSGIAFRPLTAIHILRKVAEFSLVVAIASYVLQLILRKSLGNMSWGFPKVMICDTCHRAKNNNGKDTCECGGRFENIDNWEWIEEQHDDGEENVTADGTRNTNH